MREMTIRIYSRNDDDSSTSFIYCMETDTCRINCDSPSGCRNIELYCYGSCIVDCNKTEDGSGTPFSCPSVIIGNYTDWDKTLAPTRLPTQPTAIPTVYPTSPTQNPILLPTYEPSVPSKMPTIIPSRFPSNFPSKSPSESTLAPSRIPSTIPSEIPTFFFNNFDYSALLDLILITNLFNNTSYLNKSAILQKNLIGALVDASKSARLDLRDGDSIDGIIVEITKYSNNNSSMRRRTRSTATSSSSSSSRIEFEVFIESESSLDSWINDIDNVVTEFETELTSIWDTSYSGFSTINFTLSIVFESVTIVSSNSTYESTTDGNGESLDDSDSDNSIVNIGDLNQISTIVISGIVCGFLMISLFGYIHSKYVIHNDKFSYISIIVAMMYQLDVVSDVFFSLEIATQDKIDNMLMTYVLFFLSVFFIVVPICVNLYQLLIGIKEWRNDKYSKLNDAWLLHHGKAFYIMCILFGSAFSSVEICNSHLFSLSLFEMKLSRRQRREFKNQRLFSIVLIENCPQLLLQIFYSSLYNINEVTIFASLFSLLSIITSILEYFSTSSILNDEVLLIVAINVESELVEVGEISSQEFKLKCENCTKKIEANIAKLVNIDSRLVELLYVDQENYGAQATFHIRCNGINKSISIEHSFIKTISTTNAVSNVFRNEWSLAEAPRLKVPPKNIIRLIGKSKSNSDEQELALELEMKTRSASETGNKNKTTNDHDSSITNKPSLKTVGGDGATSRSVVDLSAEQESD